MMPRRPLWLQACQCNCPSRADPLLALGVRCNDSSFLLTSRKPSWLSDLDTSSPGIPHSARVYPVPSQGGRNDFYHECQLWLTISVSWSTVSGRALRPRQGSVLWYIGRVCLGCGMEDGITCAMEIYSIPGSDCAMLLPEGSWVYGLASELAVCPPTCPHLQGSSPS